MTLFFQQIKKKNHFVLGRDAICPCSCDSANISDTVCVMGMSVKYLVRACVQRSAHYYGLEGSYSSAAPLQLNSLKIISIHIQSNSSSQQVNRWKRFLFSQSVSRETCADTHKQTKRKHRENQQGWCESVVFLKVRSCPT